MDDYEIERIKHDLESDIASLRREKDALRSEIWEVLETLRFEIKEAVRHHENRYHGKED